MRWVEGRWDGTSLGRAGAVGLAQDTEHLPAGASVLVTREVGLMAGISGRESERCLKQRGPQLWGDTWTKDLCKWGAEGILWVTFSNLLRKMDEMSLT